MICIMKKEYNHAWLEYVDRMPQFYSQAEATGGKNRVMIYENSRYNIFNTGNSSINLGAASVEIPITFMEPFKIIELKLVVPKDQSNIASITNITSADELNIKSKYIINDNIFQRNTYNTRYFITLNAASSTTGYYRYIQIAGYFWKTHEYEKKDTDIEVSVLKPNKAYIIKRNNKCYLLKNSI